MKIKKELAREKKNCEVKVKHMEDKNIGTEDTSQRTWPTWIGAVRQKSNRWRTRPEGALPGKEKKERRGFFQSYRKEGDGKGGGS